jgi:hypothetical protein
MNLRAIVAAIAVLLIGGGAGATVEAVTTKPVTDTVAIRHVVRKTKTRTETQTVTRTVTVTKTVDTGTPSGGTTGGGGGGVDTSGCITPGDAANCVPPKDRYNPPYDFCDTHQCISNFANGTGYAVQCNSGEWSMSGGNQGACSYNGGESNYP